MFGGLDDVGAEFPSAKEGQKNKSFLIIIQLNLKIQVRDERFNFLPSKSSKENGGKLS